VLFQFKIPLVCHFGIRKQRPFPRIIQQFTSLASSDEFSKFCVDGNPGSYKIATFHEQLAALNGWQHAQLSRKVRLNIFENMMHEPNQQLAA
jgi:hypothetical protein